MKTVVCRVIEGSSRFMMIPSGEMGLRFVDPEDCMFAIELDNEEELKQLDITAVPNSSKTLPIRNGNGEMINRSSALYAFRAVAVSTVEKSAEEVLADVRELEEANKQAGVDGEDDSISQNKNERSEGSHTPPVPDSES